MQTSVRSDIVEAAAALAPQIVAARDEIDSSRRLPASLAQAMADAGVYSLSIPKSMGGPECDPITAFRVIEELSKGDGAVGWCATTSNNVAVSLGWLTPEAGRRIVGQPPQVRMAGSVRPLGVARRVDGGYRVSGRWDFGSGIDVATWIGFTCKLADESGAELTRDGAPDARMMLMPADVATVIDTWSVVGMSGTGSKDVVIEDVFVPEHLAVSTSTPSLEPGQLYNPGLYRVIVQTRFAGNALGMARGAMEAFIELATRSGSTGSATLLRDRTPVQRVVGEAEAVIGSARSYVLNAVGSAWDAACAGDPYPADEVTQARLSIINAVRSAVRAVDLLFNAAGTNAIFLESPLQRYFRDLHVAMFQSGRDIFLEAAGQALLGLHQRNPAW